MGNKLTIENIQKRLLSWHGDTVTIIPETYVGSNKKATFLDTTYGYWQTTVSDVLRGHGHPDKADLLHRIPLSEIKKRILDKHGDTVILIESTYNNVQSRAIFLDSQYGTWSAAVGDVIRGSGHKKRAVYELIASVEDINIKLKDKYVEAITMDPHSYVNSYTVARFVDAERGEFFTKPNVMLTGKSGHPSRTLEKRESSTFKKYGVKNPTQNIEIALKAARTSKLSEIKLHWKTGKELVCTGSYECGVVDYLNLNKIDFLWQPHVFKIENLKTTYRPDMFLVNENIWVEIKGLMRPASKPKWEWLKQQFPTAELWDKAKLQQLGIPVRKSRRKVGR